MEKIDIGTINEYRTKADSLKNSVDSAIGAFEHKVRPMEKLGNYADYSEELAAIRSKFVDLQGRCKNLSDGLLFIAEEYSEKENKNERYMKDIAPEDDIYGNASGIFSGEHTYVEITKFDMTVYGVYKYVTDGKDFSKYQIRSKAISILESKTAGYAQLWNHGFDYKTWIKACKGEYQREYIKSSLISMLSNMPDVHTNKLDIPLKELQAIFGILKTGTDINQDILDAISNYMRNGQYVLSEAEKLKLGKENAKVAERILELVNKSSDPSKCLAYFESLKELSKIASKTGKIIKWTKLGTDELIFLLADYNNQLSYLDSMSQAIIRTGANAYDTRVVIDELKLQYSTKVVQVIDKTMELVGDKCFDKITESIPGINEAFIGVKVGQSFARLTAGNQLDALDQISGLVQYESVLEESYNAYAEMIRKGIASKTDMENAQKTWELLLSTKASLYESVAVWEKSYGADYSYIDYENKAKELRELLKGSAA